MLIKFKKELLLSILSVFILILISPLKSSVLDTLQTRVVRSFPSPGPGPSELTWDGDHLWVCDFESDSIYKINPTDFSVVFTFASPDTEPTGLAWDGQYLWHCDRWAHKVYKINPNTGIVLNSFTSPTPPPTNSGMSGLAWDGEYLWISYFAGYGSRMYQINVEDSSIVRSIGDGQNGFPVGLVYVDSSLWTTSWVEDIVIKIEMTYGMRVAQFDTPCDYPCGLAHDGNYFWLSDGYYGMIYQIEVLTTGVENFNEDRKDMIRLFDLCQNYPNPFNSSTVIRYHLNQANNIKMKIYDIMGREVITLFEGIKSEGKYELVWDGRNQKGGDLPGGVYFCSLTVGDFTAVSKIILLK